MTQLYSIIGILTSLSALIISFLVYRRQTTLDIENNFYKYKFERYEVIVRRACEILYCYQTELEKMQALLKENKLIDEEVEKLADEIDKKTDDFSYYIIVDCALLPGPVLKLVEAMTDILYKDAISLNYTDEQFEKSYKLLDLYASAIDKFIIYVHKDLGIRHLNTKLSGRLSHSNKPRQVQKQRPIPNTSKTGK